MRIGIYGGSFNPIHYGHIGLALYTLTHNDLDQLWLMVTPNNPLKDGTILSSNEQERLNLARTAIAQAVAEHKTELGNKQLIVSDYEYYLPRPSYTAQTLKHLKKDYPNNEFVLVIGEDNLMIINKWKEWEWILKNHRLIVYPRYCQDYKSSSIRLIETKIAELSVISNRIDYLKDAPLFPISSTEIRKKTESVAYHVK